MSEAPHSKRPSTNDKGKGEAKQRKDEARHRSGKHGRRRTRSKAPNVNRTMRKPVLMFLTAKTCKHCDKFKTVLPRIIRSIRDSKRVEIIAIDLKDQASGADTGKFHSDLPRFIGFAPQISLFTKDSWNDKSGSLVGTVMGGVWKSDRGKIEADVTSPPVYDLPSITRWLYSQLDTNSIFTTTQSTVPEVVVVPAADSVSRNSKNTDQPVSLEAQDMNAFKSTTRSGTERRVQRLGSVKSAPARMTTGDHPFISYKPTRR